MIVLRLNYFSNLNNSKMIEKVTEKLDRSGVYDYEVTDKIPLDVISINSDLDNLRIYIPIDLEYSQYDIDDFIRDLAPYFRTSTSLDRNIYVMKLNGKINLDQYCKLIKFIVEEEEFCSIIDN